MNVESIIKTNTILDQHPRYKAVFLYLLQTERFVTSEEISQIIGVTSRTIKNDLKVMRPEFLSLGAKLISRKGKGYYLKEVDKKTYKKTHALLQIYQIHNIPNEIQKRVNYILQRLLTTDDFIKSETLLQELMLGKDSLYQELKIIKNKLKSYNLTLVNKPHYGLKIEGAFFYRIFLLLHLYRYFHRSLRPEFASDEFAKLFVFNEKERQKLRRLLIKALLAENILLSDIYLERFIVSIFLLRNLNAKEKNKMNISCNVEFINITNEGKFIEIFSCEIAEKMNIYLDTNERIFLTLLTLMSIDLYRYVDCTYERYGAIFNQAIAIRAIVFSLLTEQLNVKLEDEQTFFHDMLKWSIPIATKILIALEDDIEISVYNNEMFLNENPLLIYTLEHVQRGIRKEFNYQLSQREKTVLYGILLNTFEAIPIEYQKMNIALIAIDGRLGTQRLKFYLNRSFSHYIGNIHAKVMYELKEKDSQTFDYYLCMEYGKNLDIKQRPIHFVKESLDEVEYLMLLKKVFMKGYGYDEQLPHIRHEIIKDAMKMDVDICNAKAKKEGYNNIFFGEKADKILYFSFDGKNQDILKIITVKHKKGKQNDIKTIIIANLNIDGDKQLLKMFMTALNTLIKYPEALKEITDKKQLNYDFIAYATKK